MSNYNFTKQEIRSQVLSIINSGVLSGVTLYSICKKVVFGTDDIKLYNDTLSNIFQVLEELVKEKQVDLDKNQDLRIIAYYTLDSFIQKAKNI